MTTTNKHITAIKLVRRILFYDEKVKRTPAFCISKVETVFPATLNADSVLLEVSTVAFRGSKRFGFEYKLLFTEANRYEILLVADNWLLNQGFRHGTYVYIKFSPITVP